MCNLNEFIAVSWLFWEKKIYVYLYYIGSQVVDEDVLNTKKKKNK